MTAVNIATSIIDKLQTENRNILETLHKCQDQVKYLERQLADKNRIIKILEDRQRVQNDGVLEMTKRQNELTIKHLEMQIQKLLKENENLEIRLEALKAEICPKCETKLLMAESRENIGPSKFTKLPGKSISAFHEKKSSQTVSPNRVKALERILEHKDKRIMHLSKEVKRLSTNEVENTKKIKRLSKLISLSRLPTDAITENLLAENQQLESQLLQRDCNSEPYIADVLNKPSTSYAYSNKTYPAKSTERFKTSAFIKPKPSSDLPDMQYTDTLDANKLENQVLQKRLQQICHSVNELKRLMASESENLSHCLNSTANEYYLLKTKLKEVINNLNEIVQNILSGDLEHKDDDLEYKSDDKHIISCLQNRLKESLNMVTEYENENKALKESLEKLKTKMTQQSFIDSSKRSEKLLSENQILQNKLDVSEKNIKACENVIETLQERNKRLEEENGKLEVELHEYKSKAVSQESERHSARYASFSEIETLKKNNQELENKIKILEETNKKLQEDINAEKSKNVLSEALSQEKILLQSKSEAAEKQISTLEKSLEILQERLKTTVNEKNRFETQLKEMIQSQNVAEAYENDVMALKNELILKEDEIEQLKERLNTLERKAAEINYYRKNLHEEVEGLYKTLMENEECEDSECRKAIYKAAILHWAHGLLQLDDNYNLKTGDSDRSSALEEMTRQTQVYLTEVSRIHELITLKEQEREEELREYLALNDGGSLKQSSSRSYETHVKGQPVNDNLQSSSTINNFKSPDIPESETVPKVAHDESARYKAVAAEYELKKVQEELEATNSVTRYLLSSCSRLEDALDKEKANAVTLAKELEDAQETIKDLKVQLNSKSHMTKRLNNLIDLMRSKEYNDEMTLDHLKNEIQWLADKATATDSELCQCKEENNKMKNELNSLKRELMNEKYEKAKTNNQLKQLRMQILNSQITLDETPIT